ncbi:ABC transporter ATP-binding protein [Arthrobacter cryoconiti]|uniref:ABC transporter ATP-binding protein n=1 Tax=Arthrobacter cryoconiti TaxID=748907 RepID=A0ABV8QYM3_9MICC|nr:ABC transporter ATP-binding protein [Arthrobacter cryoconiti]MCC9067608.1 ABC transporter ATP-binding protein [Arthrobacter cryoconiti]
MSGIELKAVSIRLANESIVHNVDLSIPSGAFLAVVGPNGSGKTTLLRAIYRAVKLSAGAIFIRDRDVSRIPMAAAARQRAVVPQFQDADVALTAADIVGTGRHTHTPWWAVQRPTEQDAVLDALQMAGAKELAGRMFGTLSGGERQRVLLARALAQKAETLLLDEPTNHLDARAQLELMELLSNLTLTRVAVLHDLDQALAYADLIAVMHAGQVVATGPPAEVLTNELTSKVFGVRSSIMKHPLTGRPHLLTAPLPDAAADVVPAAVRTY